MRERNFEARFAFARTQAQSVRGSSREVVVPFETEEGALAALDVPPPGAKVGMARQIAPTVRFLKRRAYA